MYDRIEVLKYYSQEADTIETEYADLNMERQKCITSFAIAWLLLSCPGIMSAQQSPNERVYRAYISDQMDAWDQVIVELRNRKASLSDAQLSELINFYYGYTGWAIGEGHNKKANQYILEAEDIINQLSLKYPGRPDLSAYKGAFIAYRIVIKPIRAPFLGPESMNNINHAVETGPNSPNAWIEKGNALFYMPKVFGGSKKKAMEAFKRAIQLMEKNPEIIHHNWMYLNVLMILGQSYEKIENFQMAKITYEKVLQIEPNFTYMRDKLYPSFMKARASQN